MEDKSKQARENDGPARQERSAAATQREGYIAPQLIRLGTIEEFTRGNPGVTGDVLPFAGS